MAAEFASTANDEDVKFPPICDAPGGEDGSGGGNPTGDGTEETGDDDPPGKEDGKP